MKPDAKGWYWHEKLRIVVAWYAFSAIDNVNRLLRRLHLPHRYLADSYLWLWLARQCWLRTDLRNGDMPEHQRIGGIWR